METAPGNTKKTRTPTPPNNEENDLAVLIHHDHVDQDPAPVKIHSPSSSISSSPPISDEEALTPVSDNSSWDDDGEFDDDDDYDEDDDFDWDDEDIDILDDEFENGEGGRRRKREPDIVYENALKHSSFFETAKKRRRQHLRHRKRGTVPSLHFTGTKKTEFWKLYGIEPTKLLPMGNVYGVDTILSEDELKQLGPTERRIHVNGQKFKIVSNEQSNHSLYRAICHALNRPERKYKEIKEIVDFELSDKWQMFCHDVCYYGETTSDSLPRLNPSLCSPKLMLQRYRGTVHEEEKSRGNSVPEFELKAAAIHFGFTYTVVEILSVFHPTTVTNCVDKNVLLNGTCKFYFLRTGADPGGYYEFLLPIGPLKKINDGQYPTALRDVILVEQYRPGVFRQPPTKESRHRPDTGTIPIGFGLDHRVFLHRTTISHDLWSLLAEVMFRRLIHAPQIKDRIIDSKHNFALYYFACKAKKRYQVYGKASIEKLADDFAQRFSKENPRGDIEDLAQAAAYFDFSYTLIGLDPVGNFFWRDHISQKDVKERDAPYLAFFVRTTPDKSMFWFALEDKGRLCPKERKLYRDVQGGDLSAWHGRFYFHPKPKLAPTPIDKKSLVNLTFQPEILSPAPAKVRTEILFRAKNWASKSFARLRSSVMASLSSAALRTKSVIGSIFEFLRSLRSRRKVASEKKVQALYVRERP